METGQGNPEITSGEPRREERSATRAALDIEHIRHVEKEIFQLVNYYFVFQGVIFGAFYTVPTHLKCDYKWIPMTLSSLAGVLNILAIVRLAFTYKDIKDRATKRRANTGDIDVVDAATISVWRGIYFGGSVAVIIAFLVATLVGCSVVTCDKSAPPN